MSTLGDRAAQYDPYNTLLASERMSIERLARLLRDEDDHTTLGSLAEKYGQTVERIMDAWDVLKIRSGVPTQFPPVDW